MRLSQMLHHKYIIQSCVYLCIGLFLCPIFDVLAFHFFNGHLMFMPHFYVAFCALMNHKVECFIDVALIISSMLVGLPVKRNVIKHFFLLVSLIIWYEIFFQIALLLEKSYTRASPSLSLNLYIDLSHLLENDLIKVYAQSSFPSGHAMILGYWYQMARCLFQEPWRKTSMLLSIAMCFPRLISGAHWLSDVLIGFGFGCLSFFFFRIIFLKNVKQESLC